jgi:hypothetical protein
MERSFVLSIREITKFCPGIGKCHAADPAVTEPNQNGAHKSRKTTAYPIKTKRVCRRNRRQARG